MILKLGSYRITLPRIRKIRPKTRPGIHTIWIVAPCGHARPFTLRKQKWEITFCMGCRTEKNFRRMGIHHRDERFWRGKDMAWRFVPKD